jgi:hypothetical protein
MLERRELTMPWSHVSWHGRGCEAVSSRGEAFATTLHEIEKAVGALEEGRSLQRQLAVWTKPSSCALPPLRQGA